MAFRMMLAGMLITQGFSASAQGAADAAERPAIRQLAPHTHANAGERAILHSVQFMPGMPQMPMMVPRQSGASGSMGGGMAMVMTGESMTEMAVGACAAGLFIGGIVAAAATVPAAPISPTAILGSAGLGCGLAVAATAAGMAGVLGWRALSARFQ